MLIIVTTLMYSMQLNDDALWCITKQLYITNHYIMDVSGIKKYNHHYARIQLFGRDIQALTCTNKIFAMYYSNEKRAKKIITRIAKHHDTCESNVASYLNPKGGIFQTISTKINNLFDIVIDPHKQFTKKDLEDSWYLNASKYISDGWLRHKMLEYKLKEPKYGLRQLVETLTPHTLLSMACKTVQLDKIQILIASGVACKSNINSALLGTIAQKRSTPKKKHIKRKILYGIIAQLLLEHGANPNFHSSKKWPTPLMIAAHNNDQELAFLLLRYNADPYITTTGSNQQMKWPFFYHQNTTTQNAFDVEMGEPKGWLKMIVEEI